MIKTQPHHVSLRIFLQVNNAQKSISTLPLQWLLIIQLHDYNFIIVLFIVMLTLSLLYSPLLQLVTHYAIYTATMAFW